MNPNDIPPIKYRERIAKLAEKLTIPNIDIFAIIIYLNNNNDFTWIANKPEAAQTYAESGLSRADVMRNRSFRGGNRVIFADEYYQFDGMQSQVKDLFIKSEIYRTYALSRFCTDCSMILAANRADHDEPNPQEFYKKTVDDFEDFCCYALDETIDIFTEYLPALRGTRFTTDDDYRHNIIKSRTDPILDPLSKGEIEVLYWAARGKTAEESGAILNLTKNTLDTYRKRAIAKLKATNITHAVYLAQLHGLIA